ncbi:FtsK/SpoIIIE family DNA translocase [Anaerobium acetethylicum]|uniref:DNA segregation ATPase FtsK/SpoIIIE, S-DNA-T family n=1 Tax=Anaerobium acetethylicum TaxID=1619234 RepID=A0A1D3TNK6_9FIRM|nr:DNA translocase FtsK 4TM domain-containing protein [Anaerobium acetethylicum]SCP94915.1 DNA segregation ATPase FtsK/SpoIIIE, S-DNA-T family [Anaerobium acetethylicum]
MTTNTKNINKTRNAGPKSQAKKTAAKKTQAKKTQTNRTQTKRTAARRITAPEPAGAPGHGLKDEVVLLGVLAVSILLAISSFGAGGLFGRYISGFLFGMFGIMAYLFPFLLFLGAAFAVSNRNNRIAHIKIAAEILLFIVMCTFMQLISTGRDGLPGLSEYYRVSSLEKKGGGLIGGLLADLLTPAFGLAGAYVVIIIGIIICVVMITEKSFFRGVKKGSSKVYVSARDDVAKRKERHKASQEARALRKELRMEKKVSGVAIDTKITAEAPEADEIHEISEAFPETAFDTPAIELAALPEEQLLAYGEDMYDFEAVFAYDHEMAGQEQTAFFGIDAVPEQDGTQGNPCFAPETGASSGQDGEEEEEIPFQEADPMDNRADQEPPAAEAAVKQPAASDQQEESGILQEPADSPVKYEFPPIDLLHKGSKKSAAGNEKHLRETAIKLQKTLENFGVGVAVTNVSCGPSVTRYELQPEQGVKVSKIVSLADDIKLNLAAADIRIEAPIPGKAAVGIEVPNKENSAVMLRDLLESDEFRKHPSNIAFAAGKDISGQVVVTDIAKMPHLLIAGATGSGKSVCINTIIMSILYKADPADVKLIMIDPKVVELSVYNGIPHLFIPVVTDPKKAAGALNWAVAEMTERYKKFADLNVRDLKGYNEKIETIKDIEEDGKPEKLPQIVIIVDELADLMMVAPGEVEDAICRLAQLARAAGIHLVIATQRPSVNVITGLIKANMPSRIAFSVSSGVDSRTIIDMNGAEKLLGKGDMLFYPSGYQKPARVQGAFVSDGEVGDVVNFLTSKHSAVVYNSDIETKINSAQASAESGSASAERDAYFTDAGKFIIEKDKASIGMLQRVFKIGFNRAARIMDQLSEAGVVGDEEGTKPRKVLMSIEEFEEYIDEYI